MNLTQRESRNEAVDRVSRVCAAVPAGYLVANLVAIALGMTLPVARVHAVQISLLVSFLIYTVIVLRVFSLSSHRRAWIELLALAIGSGALVLLSLPASAWER